MARSRILGRSVLRLALVAVAVLAPRPSLAAITTTCVGACQLSELLAGATITVDDVTFSGFRNFSANAFFAVPVDAADIDVIPGTAPSLMFASSALISPDFSSTQSAVFTYDVAVAPGLELSGAHLSLGSSSAGLAKIDINELVTDDIFLLLGQNEVLLEGADPSASVFSHSVTFPGQEVLVIQTLIALQGPSALGDFTELFDVRPAAAVPLPGSLALLAVGALAVGASGVARRRRR